MARWFEFVSSPESISAIATAVATIIGAIATFVYKLKGKSTKEILEKVIADEGKILADTLKTQGKIIEECITKKKDKDKSKT